MELHEAVTYRIAFALADRLREAEQENFPGRWRSNRAAGGAPGAIVAEVLRQLEGGGPVDVEVVREAVDDVLEGRRPRW